MYFHDDEYYMDGLPPIAHAEMAAYYEAMDCLEVACYTPDLKEEKELLPSREVLIERLSEMMCGSKSRVYGRFGRILEYSLDDLAIKMAHRGDFDEYVR